MVRDFSQKTVQELYETIRVNVDEEEQWKVFDFVEDFFMEELEIGDYINDINSYHLHMFDKHDVTTKKFDAIVEKAGKVDANYAAQIEGYCSLLGEYGKKFEAVCAMLQPEKLRLSPDKYREKLEGINTGYQNAKDTHEQEQSDYEAELYEIETVWYKKMLDKAEDYLIRSAECIVLGNFTDEVTVLGVGVQIVLGIFDLDLPCDIRDIIADVRNLAQADEIKWDMIAMLALDLIGLIPVIGALKYSDEIGTLFKNADKVSVVARSTDGAGVLAKHADEAGAWLHGGKVFRYSDETAEAVASGEKLLKESQTVYESFADMMSPDDAAKYLDFLENGSREGLTSAELAGVEKADALLVSQKVGYEDVWDLRNAGDVLESGSKGGTGERLIPGMEGVVAGGDSTKLGKNMMESMGLPRGTNWTGHQAQHIIPTEMANHLVLQRIGMDLDDASNGLFLRTPADDISAMSRHRGYHSIYNEFVKTQLDAMDISQSVDVLQKQVYDLQQNLKYLQQSGLPLYPSQGATVDLWQRSLERIQ